MRAEGGWDTRGNHRIITVGVEANQQKAALSLETQRRLL